MQGRVWRLYVDKGFGFIRPDGARKGDKDIFFHRSACQEFDTLKESDVVEFSDPVPTDKGLRAEQVDRV